MPNRPKDRIRGLRHHEITAMALTSSSSSGRASATTCTIVLVGKFEPQNFPPRFVDVAMVAHVRGEDVQCNDIIDGAAGGFDEALNLSQDETRLRLGVADADDLAVMIRSRLAGDEYHSARLGNVHQRVDSPRGTGSPSGLRAVLAMAMSSSRIISSNRSNGSSALRRSNCSANSDLPKTARDTSPRVAG